MPNSDEVIWEDPPARQTPGGSGVKRPAPYWAVLRANPGRWARVPCKASGAGTFQKRQVDFEVTTRWVKGEGVTYARYIGPV